MFFICFITSYKSVLYIHILKKKIDVPLLYSGNTLNNYMLKINAIKLTASPNLEYFSLRLPEGKYRWLNQLGKRFISFKGSALRIKPLEQIYCIMLNFDRNLNLQGDNY